MVKKVGHKGPDWPDHRDEGGGLGVNSQGGLVPGLEEPLYNCTIRGQTPV